MLQNLETLSREARSWPFEQARNLLAHVLKKRLSDAERDFVISTLGTDVVDMP